MNIKDTQGEKGGTESAVKQILEEHQEAIVITLDPEKDDPSESKIGVFTKLMEEGSKLSAILDKILVNLQRTRDGKTRSSVENTTTSLSKKRGGKGPKDCAGGGKAIICKYSKPT